MKRDYINVQINVLDEPSVHEANVLNTLTVGRFIKNIRQEFQEEIRALKASLQPETEVGNGDTQELPTPNLHFCLWQEGDVHPLSSTVSISTLNNRQRFFFHTVENAPRVDDYIREVEIEKLVQVSSRPLEAHETFRLQTENNKIIQSGQIPVVIGRSAMPLDYQMHHQPILKEHTQQPDIISTISREHIAIFRHNTEGEKHRFYIVHINANNQTYLNGDPLEHMWAYPLQDHDIIELGGRGFQLTFRNR